MRTLERQAFRAMGTSCTATVACAPTERPAARRALAAAVAEIAACEKALSRFDPASELSALNGRAGAWTPVGRRLFDAVAAALDARAATGGRFDPTVLPALMAAGYDRSFEDLRPRPPAHLTDWRAGAAVELDGVRGRARLAAGAALDLGGIGKGFAAARALAAAAAVWPALPGALIDLGGDLAILGDAPDGAAWRVGVADPRAPGGRLAVLRVAGGGVATSGRDRRRFGPRGTLHHLIDPATGRPAIPGPLAVTVVAPTAVEAEVHATALAVTPVADAAAYVAARPGASALVVPASGPVFVAGRLPYERAVAMRVPA